MRGSSVPPSILIRARSGSLPPQSFDRTRSLLQRTSSTQATVQPGAIRSATLVTPASAGRAATAYRRASIAVPAGLTLHAYRTAAASARTRSPVRSSSPTKLYTLSSTARSYSPARVITAADRRAPAANAYYRKPLTPSLSYRGTVRPSGSAASSTTSRGRISAPRSSVNVDYEVDEKVKNEFVANGPQKLSYKITNVETKDQFLPKQRESLAELRTRLNIAKDQSSRHKVLLDRYLPIQLGPAHDVEDEVQYKYGELVQRMPQLEYSHRSNRLDEGSAGPATSSPLVEPYKPLQRGPKIELFRPAIPVRNSFTPKISDTRKRARSVLCKIKGDPKYFDFS